MRVSYHWLSQYVDLSGVTAEQLAESLTRAGIEVEEVHALGDQLKNMVIGYVRECKPHPAADKLSLCQVDLGEGEPVQIVCGAKNVKAGQKVPVAKVGAVLPGGVKIKKAKLRGEVSEGMICSAKELGIDDRLQTEDQKAGIMVLPDDAPLGEDAISYLGLNDYILELSVTPNRSDCLSLLGVAYEVAAVLDRDLYLPDINLKESDRPVHQEVHVEVEAGEACPYYVARKVTGVKIGPSPMWLQNRLRSAGVRPINNVVDVTNYVMFEYGQPLHAFDARKVTDGRIVVRTARKGEVVVTLDDQERTLEEGMLIISDPEKVIAIAGVMGAANSEVTESTTDVILESAYFDPGLTRRTSKALDLRSEASQRFEKGVDPERVEEACARAAQLLAELAGGTVLKGISVSKTGQFTRRRVCIPMVKLNNVLGTQLKPSEVQSIFERLRFDCENLGHEWQVDVPTRRPDISIEEDLIEEVARLYGYDRIPTTLPQGVTTPGSRTPKQRLKQRIKTILQGAGLDQVVTYSLVSEQQAAWGSWFEEDVHPIPLAMPMTKERSFLRTTLIPSLLEVAQYNKNRQQSDVHLFEIGRTFLAKELPLKQLPTEKEVVAGLLSGMWLDHGWQQVRVPVDFFVVKGIVEGLFKQLGVGPVQYKKIERDHYHPGRTAEILLEGERLGFIGQLHPVWQKELELKEVYLFELDLERLHRHWSHQVSYEPLPKYPGVERDLAIVVAQAVKAGSLLETIKEAGGSLLKHVDLFDVYTGPGIEEGKKSVAFSLVFRHPDRTLTDEEVQEIHQRILDRLAEQWGAVLR
jgi:phenylalanyl-tRNA synthetase beta chain